MYIMYLWVSSRSCSRLSAAASMGRICFVSSGLRICSSASLVSFFIVCGKSVRLAIRIMILLLWAVANAGATMMVTVPSNCGKGCTSPVTSFVFVVITIALTVVVCCGGSVWFPSTIIWSGFGLQFFILSVMANVISTCGKLMVPFAVSTTAWWFLMKFSPIIGKDVFERMTKVSVNVYVPMLNCISAVAIGCSSWAFAHSILKGGWGYSFMMQLSLFILIAL